MENFDAGRDGCASGGWGRTGGLTYWREMGARAFDSVRERFI